MESDTIALTPVRKIALRIAQVVRSRIAEVSLPTATYRLQLHHGFTFQDAAKLMPYLKSLGISHV